MKDLTIRYSVTQFTFWAAYTGTSSFATTWLLDQGMPSGVVGVLLAAAGILSCLTQPALAGVADKARGFVLDRMLVWMSAFCALCAAVQMIPGIPMMAAGLAYAALMWSSDAMVPLVNGLSIACPQAGYPINYGAARGIGSAASAVASLVIGYVLARYGAGWMILILIAFRLFCILSLLGYPKIGGLSAQQAAGDDGCSVWSFFRRYKWYCLSLLGILFLGMFHAMTENYMIAIVGRLGGDSSHVGIALAISCIAGAPVIFFYSRIRKRIPEELLLRIAAVSFLVKAVLFRLAGSIGVIYGIQLLQITSYGFLAPAQVFYAGARVRRCDMVKGQAFITAAYALGCSCGNFAGGALLHYGVDAMLMAGILMTMAGTVILFATVGTKDRSALETV